MTRADDSSLDPEDRRAVEERARRLLDRANAWGRFPTPINDILEAAKIKVAPKSMFDLRAVAEYLKGKATEAAQNLKSAVSKLFGLYDATDLIIHIDQSVVKSKQSFLKLHETGHHEIPAHRKTFRLFEECQKTLSPEIADQFEREANNFARFALFQGDAYARQASDHPLAIKSFMSLAKDFGASLYASAREFARTNHRACAVYVLEPLEFIEGDGVRAVVRRIEVSPSFREKYGEPNCTQITPTHFLGRILPIGKKMRAPASVGLVDRNGTLHDCVAESFDTKYNIIILLYPRTALTRSIIMPSANGIGTISSRR